MNLLSALLSRISFKLFFLGIIPLLIVTAVITWHTIDTRTQEIETTLRETANQAATNLAETSEFALYSGRLELLQSLAANTRNFPLIHGVAYIDTDGLIIADTGLPPDVDTRLLTDADPAALGPLYHVVSKPVYLQATDVADYEERTEEARTLLGWVVVIGDRGEVTAKIEQILVNHLIISFVVLIGAAVLSYLLSHTFLAPIRRMTDVVKALERGNLNQRIAPTTNDELAILANGINHLSFSVSEARQTLEKKVAHATAQLQQTLVDLREKNRQLVQAKSEAEAANHAKSAFLAQMSHELRTPVTAIQGFVKLLDSSTATGAEKRYIAIVQQASVQLLQLIDDILDITKLQSNAIVLESTPFNLMECLEHPVTLMAPIAHEKGLELVLDVAPEVPLNLLGDSLRIRQVIYNLLSNAIKFTSSGDVVLKVRSQTQGRALRLLIAVTDTGIGVSESQIKLIFEPFSQADNSISRRFGGTGLGLSIVRNLVDLMRGSIDLHSNRGKGSTFVVELPLTTAERQPEPPRSRHRNVVLFDSHPQSRQALEHLLYRFSQSLESCEEFTEISERRTALQPDILVFSCSAMSSSEELLDQLTVIRTRVDCPILVISPLSTSLLHAKSATLPSLEPLFFIDKPATYRELTRVFGEKPAPGNEATGFSPVAARLLVAEDNEFARILLDALLERSGCSYRMVTNGREAIAACSEETFDLILMDVHMPEVTGAEALATLRRNPGPNQHTPIIMLTADILQQEESALFDAGASDLVFKPIDEEKLFHILQQHLSDPFPVPATTINPPTIGDQHRTQFVAEVDKLVSGVDRSLGAGDVAGMRDSLHQLLGIAGVFKMRSLERAVSELHRAVKAEHEEKTLAAMETLRAEVTALKTTTPAPADSRGQAGIRPPP